MTAYDQVWRPNRLAAPVGYLLALGFAALGIVIAVQGRSGGPAIPVFCAVPFIALGTWRLASVPFVAASADGVVVQNPLLRRTIPWQNVLQIEGGYYGLLIRTKDGDTVTAWAVQKSNVARWFHQHTRSDDVAAALLGYRDATKHGPSPK